VDLSIPADVTELESDAGAEGGASLPAGAVQARNDFGDRCFGGAAPPAGPVHRYVFTVHALDVDSLGVEGDASPAVVGLNLTGHTLARAVIVPEYSR